MAGFTGPGGHHRLRAEINVTPLVDVVLVLLIIFMVVTPMLGRGKDVKLPVVSAGGDVDREKPEAVVLTMSAGGGLWLENHKVGPEELAQALTSRLQAQPAREVLIKADASVSVRALRPVLQQLKAVQISQIGFVVSELGKGAP